MGRSTRPPAVAWSLLGLLGLALYLLRGAVFQGRTLYECDIQLSWQPQVSSIVRCIGAGSWPAVYALTEDTVRRAARALVALGGEWNQDVLSLDTEEGPLSVGTADLMLLVRGPIAREYQVPPDQSARRPRLPGLEDGYRIHLHRRRDARPVELDPGAFDFGRHRPGQGSSLLELSSWARELGQATPVDEQFRRLPPVLAPSQPPSGALKAAAVLQRTVSKGQELALILDNLEQFRYYSAWRAAVERQRRQAPPG